MNNESLQTVCKFSIVFYTENELEGVTENLAELSSCLGSCKMEA